MDKNKEYTKMILSKLHRRAEDPKIKSNGNSNQKTQATPSDLRKSLPDARTFFDHFQTHCVVYHQPVILRAQRKQLIRPLSFQLTELHYRAIGNQRIAPSSSSIRLPTIITYTSQFLPEQPKRCSSRMSAIEQKDNRWNSIKKIQDKSGKIGQTQSTQYITRYRSLKTMPSTSNTGTFRRMLVNPPTVANLQRRESIDNKNFKNYQRKRVSPRRQLTKRCQSFEKYLAGKGF